ncbi:Ig-like domain-containing protein, partial [Candidatus Desantisbacteria bacterium]|nr:Ig-like domain-containing protein [Candidatus Desantisbacteria bacterium]
AILNVSPVNNAVNVNVNTLITAAFSEVMESATINADTFTIDGVTGTVTYSGNTAVFTPSVPFANSTKYTATISTGVKDKAGNALVSNYSWIFETEKKLIVPKVFLTYPLNNAKNELIKSSITATFSKIMDSSTITSSTFYLNNGVTGTVTFNGITAVFVPSSLLAFNTKYTVTITNEVKDLDGNPLKANYEWTFTTGAEGKWAKIVSKNNYIIALKSDGTLWSWGENNNWQLGDGTTDNKNRPIQIGTDTDWAAIAAGNSHCIALKSNGTLYAWGRNNYGQLGDGTNIFKNIPTKIGIDSDWADIAAGVNYTIALKSDGTLWSWGEGLDGKLGLGTTTDKWIPTKIGVDTDWAEITVYSYHTMALKNDGTLWGWGNNYYGQLGDGTNSNNLAQNNRNSPIRIGVDIDWAVVSAGDSYTMALKSNGELYAFGYNFYGQLGNGTTANKNIPTKIGQDTDWVSIIPGNKFSMAIKSNGTLFTWGINSYGQLGDGTTNNRNSPIQTGTDTDWVTGTSGGNHSACLKSNGDLFTCGNNAFGQAGDGSPEDINTPLLIGNDSDWQVLAAGGEHATALKTNGKLYVWGYNNFGQLGILSTENMKNPVTMDLYYWQEIAAGGYHTIAIKDNGTLYAWGYNGFGQLGDNSIVDKKSIQQISSNTNWLAITAGRYHSAGLKTDSTLYGWGNNSFGQISGGLSQLKINPTQIGTERDWIAVSAGGYHTIALKTDSALYGWGDNYYGQLGNGTNTNKNIPTQIGTDENWGAVAAGGIHTIALKKDGRLYGWGDNYYGQLGNGSFENKNIPTQIGIDNDWQVISAGEYHTIALKKDGRLYGWGDNDYGQLGNGSFENKNIPTQIGVDSDWQTISAGKYYTIALKKDGKIYGWGDNAFGQISNISTWHLVPYQVVNNAPISYNQSVSTDEDIPLPITLTGYDSDSDDLRFIVDIQTSNGSLKGVAPDFIYVPNANFKGKDSLTFHVQDGLVESVVSTVDIAVNSINDVPIANDQFVVASINTDLNITLNYSDSDGNSLSLYMDSSPINGTLKGTAPNLIYTPNLNYEGKDSFTYHVNDGMADSKIATVSINVGIYIDNGNGTITDLSTNLMWQKNSSFYGNFADADSNAKNSTLAEYTDWRLPTIAELQTLLTNKTNPKINTGFFPNSSGNYWSSDTGGAYNTFYHFYLNLYDGSFSSSPYATFTCYTLFVRRII